MNLQDLNYGLLQYLVVFQFCVGVKNRNPLCGPRCGHKFSDCATFWSSAETNAAESSLLGQPKSVPRLSPQNLIRVPWELTA